MTFFHVDEREIQSYMRDATTFREFIRSIEKVRDACVASRETLPDMILVQFGQSAAQKVADWIGEVEEAARAALETAWRVQAALVFHAQPTPSLINDLLLDVAHLKSILDKPLVFTTPEGVVKTIDMGGMLYKFDLTNPLPAWNELAKVRERIRSA